MLPIAAVGKEFQSWSCSKGGKQVEPLHYKKAYNIERFDYMRRHLERSIRSYFCVLLYSLCAKHGCTCLMTNKITCTEMLLLVKFTLDHVFSQRYFIASSRELTRLESISEAPIIHHFSETVVGLSTIRAFGHQDRFVKVNLDRLNTNVSINFHDRAAVDWLGFRLESIGTGILCSSALLLVLLPSSFIQPGFRGFQIPWLC